MMDACILACHASAAERFLFEQSPLGPALAAHTARVLAALGAVRPLAIVLPGREQAFLRAGIPVHVVPLPADDTGTDTVSALWAIRRHLRTALPQGAALARRILAVSPGLGPVTATRIRSLLAAHCEGADADALLSLLPTPVNCNPAWLHTAPSVPASAPSVTMPFQTETSGGARLRGQDGETPWDKPAGSQWLPPFQHFDGAVAYLRTDTLWAGDGPEPCSDARSENDAPPRVAYKTGGETSLGVMGIPGSITADGESLPLLYALPLFDLHPDQPVHWSLTEQDAERLLHPFPAPCHAAHPNAVADGPLVPHSPHSHGTPAVPVSPASPASPASPVAQAKPATPVPQAAESVRKALPAPAYSRRPSAQTAHGTRS
ncbi:hypothetical protein [Desulfovibrio psychrotolerans]|uniref:Uncharacterized protein n=1 Tax=Desulfovibrio psychrotolerans TaxID=415242 RepID=A0A7J0BXH0_9BACT|nr:hypothetical protein [Desulfovibrio psychrotolerans]GFM37885.1 hypothetical protein DSM19430T_25690 [Desulfovibrio psychrotolerans]